MNDVAEQCVDILPCLATAWLNHTLPTTSSASWIMSPTHEINNSKIIYHDFTLKASAAHIWIVWILIFPFLCRHQSLRSSRVDQVSTVHSGWSDSLVPGHPAPRHGVWRHSLRVWLPDTAGSPRLVKQHSSQQWPQGSHLQVNKSQRPEAATWKLVKSKV